MTPEPTLAHPAATPFATPTTSPENMELIQNWQVTKLAREKPIKNRATMKELAVEMKETERTAGAVRRETTAEVTRGPKMSQAGPTARREKMAPTKAAIPAVPTSAAVRWRWWRMAGSSGGMEKVEKKQEKREIQARWKARMCGGDMENGRNSVALWSGLTFTEEADSIAELSVINCWYNLFYFILF